MENIFLSKSDFQKIIEYAERNGGEFVDPEEMSVGLEPFVIESVFVDKNIISEELEEDFIIRINDNLFLFAAAEDQYILFYINPVTKSVTTLEYIEYNTTMKITFYYWQFSFSLEWTSDYYRSSVCYFDGRWREINKNRGYWTDEAGNFPPEFQNYPDDILLSFNRTGTDTDIFNLLVSDPIILPENFPFTTLEMSGFARKETCEDLSGDLFEEISGDLEDVEDLETSRYSPTMYGTEPAFPDPLKTRQRSLEFIERNSRVPQGFKPLPKKRGPCVGLPRDASRFVSKAAADTVGKFLEKGGNVIGRLVMRRRGNVKIGGAVKNLFKNKVEQMMEKTRLQKQLQDNVYAIDLGDPNTQIYKTMDKIF